MSSYWWVPPAGSDPARNYLIPAVDFLELHALPKDSFKNARIEITGDPSLAAFQHDLTIFVITTLVSLVPGENCFIPEEALAHMALRSSFILGSAATMAVLMDGKALFNELGQVGDEFLNASSEAAKELGVSCAFDALQSLIKKPVVWAEIVTRFLVWYPGIFLDMFTYQARAALMSMVYTPDIKAVNWAKMEASWGKDDEAAITALEEIMKIDPGYRETKEKLYALLVGKADRLQKEGNRDGAIAALKRALEVNREGKEAKQQLASLTSSIIAYWNAQGQLITHNLTNGSSATVPSPEAGINKFTISADLSTYVWVPPSKPWRLMVKRQGQSSQMLLTWDQFRQAAGQDLNRSDDPWANLSLSADGAVVAVGPLSVGASGNAFRSLILRTADGSRSDNSNCNLPWPVLSPSGELAAGSISVAPGAQAGSRVDICALAKTAGIVSTKEGLQAALDRSVSDRTDTYGGSGSIAYEMESTWGPDSRSIVFIRSRKSFNASVQRCEWTNSILLVTSTETKTLYSQAPQQYANSRDCPWPGQVTGLARPAISADGRTIAFVQYPVQRTAGTSAPSIWVVNADGSGLHRIAEGTNPLWVAAR